jgi:hypothetical protein
MYSGLMFVKDNNDVDTGQKKAGQVIEGWDTELANSSW